jgi:hypothetical protein
VKEGTPTLLGPLERANLDYWTTYINISIGIRIPETRLCQKEITGNMYNKNCDKAWTDLKLR